MLKSKKKKMTLQYGVCLSIVGIKDVERKIMQDDYDLSIWLNFLQEQFIQKV